MSTTTATADADTRRQLRETRFQRGLAALRSAGSPPDRALVLVGGALVPVGLVLVVLGWRGAARTGYVFEQVPFLISGGLLGLGLVFLGGFLFFAYWLTRIITEARQHNARLVAQNAQLIESLDALHRQLSRRTR